MFDDGAMIRMLGMLAAAPTDQTKWADLLTEVCTISGVSNASSFLMTMKRRSSDPGTTRGIARRRRRVPYASHYRQFDEWGTRRLRNDRPGQVMLGEEVWPEAEFRKSLFYNEYLKPLDLCQITGIAFLRRRWDCSTMSAFYAALARRTLVKRHGQFLRP